MCYPREPNIVSENLPIKNTTLGYWLERSWVMSDKGLNAKRKKTLLIYLIRFKWWGSWYMIKLELDRLTVFMYAMLHWSLQTNVLLRTVLSSKTLSGIIHILWSDLCWWIVGFLYCVLSSFIMLLCCKLA